jgi:hypothetical protein
MSGRGSFSRRRARGFSITSAGDPGMIFNVVYRCLVPCLGHAQAIGAITHRLCRLIWKLLHERIRYEERGPAVSVEAKKVRARKMIRELRSLGYRVELPSPPAGRSGLIREIFDPD